MNTDSPPSTNTEKPTRRKILTAIGMVAGSDALYQAMTTLGYGAEPQFNGPPRLLAPARGLQSWCWVPGWLACWPPTKCRRRVTRFKSWNIRTGQAAGTGRCMAAFIHRTWRGHAEGRFHVRQLPQSRPVADSVSSSNAVALLQSVQRRAGALHPVQSQRLCSQHWRIQGQAVAVQCGRGGF